jgi:thymidylate synthase ThyX
MAPAGEGEALKLVEICGRTAYKSEDKITEDSAKSFVLMLKKHGHLSVLEHSNIVFQVETGERTDDAANWLAAAANALVRDLQERNAYHRIYRYSERSVEPAGFAVAGNFRAWIETLPFLQVRRRDQYRFLEQSLGQFYPTIFPQGPQAAVDPALTVSVLDADRQLALLKQDPASDLPVFVFKIVCDRGITHEIVRHRVFSFTQESTRYVNYKNKGMTLILPEELEPFFDDAGHCLDPQHPLVETWRQRAASIFQWYQDDLGRGRRPEIARDILPNLLKSEIFVSGRWSGWRHFIALRDSKQAHPRIRRIARQVREYFESIGLTCP